MNRIFMYQFESEDEDGKTNKGLVELEDINGYSAEDVADQCIDFLSQTNESYLDICGFVHEIYNDKDQFFAYYFEIENDFDEVCDKLISYLDNYSIVKDKELEKAIREVYNAIMQMRIKDNLVNAE